MSRNKKHHIGSRVVEIRLTASSNERLELEAIAEFKARYAAMSPGEQQCSRVQAERAKFDQLYEDRQLKNARKIGQIKKRLAAKGVTGLNGQEYREYKSDVQRAKSSPQALQAAVTRKPANQSNPSAAPNNASAGKGSQRGITDYKRFWAAIFGVAFLIITIQFYPYGGNTTVKQESDGVAYRPPPRHSEPFVRPIPQKPIPHPSEPSKPPEPPLPEATVEAVFLGKTFGTVVDLITRPGEQKTPMQEFLEELLVAHPRKNAPGRWIDDIPDTKPTKPDIAPRLPEKTLYFDQTAANAHWPAFEKRNPQTTAYLKKYMDRAWVTKMPGDAAVSGQWDKKLATSFVKAWRKDSEKFIEHDYKYKKTPKLYFVSIGECVLYADFLISRGDGSAKSVGFDLLNAGCFALDLHIRPYAPDKALGWHVGREMFWPAVDVKAGRFNRWVPVFLSSALFNLRQKGSPDYLHVGKWAVNHTPCDSNFKRLLLIQRCNAYTKAHDPIGGVITLCGGIPADGWDRSNLLCLRNRMIEAFGKDPGAERYRRCLEVLLPNSGAKRKIVKDTLLRERAAHNKNTR